jgi:hypothetical protein
VSGLPLRSFVQAEERVAGKTCFKVAKVAYGHQLANQRGQMVYHRPENGFGFDFYDNILVSEGTGLQMGSTPATREWCLLSP